MKEPILATKDYIDSGCNHRIDVFGGCHYIKGNKSPYFSLTCWYGTPLELSRGTGSGGAAHDKIRQHFGGRFRDLETLHLSDIDGVPMHVLENGFFRFYDDGGSHGKLPSWADRRMRLARHFRISEKEVDDELLPLMGPHYSSSAGVFTNIQQKKFWGVGCPDAKARLANWIETQKPRWKAEADACIVKHGLIIYGDKWSS